MRAGPHPPLNENDPQGYLIALQRSEVGRTSSIFMTVRGFSRVSPRTEDWATLGFVKCSCRGATAKFAEPPVGLARITPRSNGTVVALTIIPT